MLYLLKWIRIFYIFSNSSMTLLLCPHRRALCGLNSTMQSGERGFLRAMGCGVNPDQRETGCGREPHASVSSTGCCGASVQAPVAKDSKRACCSTLSHCGARGEWRPRAAGAHSLHPSLRDKRTQPSSCQERWRLTADRCVPPRKSGFGILSPKPAASYW